MKDRGYEPDETDELRQKVDDIVYRCFAQGQYWGSGLGKDPEAFNEDYRPDNPINRTEAVEAIMHLITTHTLRARVDELSLAIKMAGKVFVSRDKVLMDLTSLGMGDPDNISAEVLKTRLTTLTAELNHQKSQKEGE